MLSPNAPWPSCEITVWAPTGTTPYLCARYVDPAKKPPRMTPIQPSVTAAFLASGGWEAATPSENASTAGSAPQTDEKGRINGHDGMSSTAPRPRGGCNQSERGPEVLLRDKVRPAPLRVGVHGLTVARDDDDEQQQDEAADLQGLVGARGPSRHEDEQHRLGGVGNGRQRVGGEDGEADNLVQPLGSELQRLERLADQEALDVAPVHGALTIAGARPLMQRPRVRYSSTWAPTSNTWFGGILKKAVARSALRDMNENSCARHSAMPGRSEATRVSRPKKNVVPSIRVSSDATRHAARTSPISGSSMNP